MFFFLDSLTSDSIREGCCKVESIHLPQMQPGLWVEFEFVPLFAERGFSLGLPGVFFLS